jgi:hypothetical protein
MKMIESYKHKIASHCESGSVRNLLNFSGFDISEQMVFGIGSGILFAYLFFTKGPGGFPVTAIRLPMGAIVANISKRLGADMFMKKYSNPDDPMKLADRMIDAGKPVTLCVDMFYMKYLPKLMQIHVPFHFIVLIGRDEDNYYISDPYYDGIGKLSREEIRLAWNTHSLLAKDNFIAYVVEPPKSVDWKKVLKKSLRSTCMNILLGPGAKQLFPMFGANGIRMFAREMLKWPEKYRGLPLREGMLYTPTILEEQGTGGGAFRFIYGAFLFEASSMLNSPSLKEKAAEMVENGNQWREASRGLIGIAKEIPVDSKNYDDWFSKNKGRLDEGLQKVSGLFIQRANDEERIFTDIARIIKTIK